MLPLIEELSHLEEHGLTVIQNGQEVCRAKVHLILCSGDIPAVKDMAHVQAHTGKYGCRICEVEGKAPDNRSSGKYFEESNARMRPLRDFLNGNPVSNNTNLSDPQKLTYHIIFLSTG